MESIKALRPLKNQLGNIEHCEPHFSMSEKTPTLLYTTRKIHAARLVCSMANENPGKRKMGPSPFLQ